MKVSARAPGEDFSTYNYVDRYESNDYLSASVVTRFVAIYDIPNCSWIKEGGIRYDIISIIEEDCSLLLPPKDFCQAISGAVFLSPSDEEIIFIIQLSEIAGGISSHL